MNPIEASLRALSHNTGNALAEQDKQAAAPAPIPAPPAVPLHLGPAFFKDLEAVTLLLECDPKPVWLRAAASELETMANYLRTVATVRERAAARGNQDSQP